MHHFLELFGSVRRGTNVVMDDPHPVIEGLRQKLRGARSAAPFAGELESRIRQLAADMVVAGF